jgi:predicted acylesterase/phospholipase RssA
MCRITATLGLLLCVAAPLPSAASAADPCAGAHARSLVLSGGGAKGAFEAGAAYHLIVHRDCDFVEIAGNSVGAINGALLAQAVATRDAAASLASLRDAAERLVDEWGAIGRPRDVMRTRPLGRVRFALFGLDSVADLEPLRRFVRDRVALDKLAAGRELRIGLTTFVDGRYREIVINAGGRVEAQTAHELIFGSAVVPVFGRMVRVAPPSTAAGPLQLADGGIRHATPVTSYFLTCGAADEANAAPLCIPVTGPETPPHPRTEQLFVIITSPFARRTDLRPVVATRAFDRGGGGISDGRQILVRMFDLLVDTIYRDDLDDMLTFNDLLEWRAQAVAAGESLTSFPLGSYNGLDAPGSRSLPYKIALIAPQREDSDPMSIFDVEPATQRRQLFCGCIAADEAMQTQFGLPGMAARCEERFPGLVGKRYATETRLDPAACRDERTAVSPGVREADDVPVDR